MDLDHYATLLAQARPVYIETPEEHDRMLLEAERLMERGDALSEEEEKLLTLLVFLIRSFEDEVMEGEEGSEEDEGDQDGPAELPQPHQTLQHLMQARGLELHDIADIFGNPHLAREAVEGKRPITRSQAKQLGRFFSVPPKLFEQ